MSDPAKKPIPGTCPTPEELGASGWNILHSAAAVYPYRPSSTQREAMKAFITSWAHVYACNWCAFHMRQYVAAHPPTVDDKISTSQYVCRLHNEVNERIGKEVVSCDADVLLRRWHPGYPNKMEDRPPLEEQLAAEKKKMKLEQEKIQQKRSEEEKRLSDFGLPGRHDGRPHEAAAWRDSSNPSKNNNKSTAPPRRWWFFGGAAVDPSSSSSMSAADASLSSPPPHTQAPPGNSNSSGHKWREGSAAPPPAEGGMKAADEETDVDAVLKRLKACQVYCPEDEQKMAH